VLCQRHLQIRLAQDTFPDSRSLDGVLLIQRVLTVETGFRFFLGPPFGLVLCWYTFHSKNLNIVAIATGKRVR